MEGYIVVCGLAVFEPARVRVMDPRKSLRPATQAAASVLPLPMHPSPTRHVCADRS